MRLSNIGSYSYELFASKSAMKKGRKIRILKKFPCEGGARKQRFLGLQGYEPKNP